VLTVTACETVMVQETRGVGEAVTATEERMARTSAE